MKKRLVHVDIKASEEEVLFSAVADPLNWSESPDTGYIECDNVRHAQETVALLAKPSPSEMKH